MRCTPYLLIAITACGSSGSGDPPKKTTEEPMKLAGVYPDKFKCASIADEAALGQVLGGTIRTLDTPSSVPRGLPHPCNYEVAIQSQPEYWTFDFDCRDGMKQRADALFAQYTRTSADLVSQYNIASDAPPTPGVKVDAGKKDPDAGIDAPQRAPEESASVDVGAKGLDHHGQGLLFIDDDAPCYVRIVGPDRDRRLALAKLVAKNLTFANAPMTPRAFPK